ncbi:MAG TPA: hypothetical protein VKT22_00560 [Steroidobacteraceae bacterium]|nr:hypothetical protein [Steroidobacteraceae bacterium]
MRSARWIEVPLAVALLALLGPAIAQERAPSPEAVAATHRDGIWKAVVPAGSMRGEFNGLDPIGLAAGASIQADCSLNWVNPDDGARYCFSSGTSLELFLDAPQANIARARAGWRRIEGTR